MKKFISSLIILLLFTLTACHKKKLQLLEKELAAHQRGRDILTYISLVQKQKNQAVDDFIRALPLEERIAQLFVVNLVGCDTFIPVEENIAGGFLFFGYNIAQTPVQMQQFNQSIINYCRDHGKIPPFLTVDQEGGYVNRLRSLNGPLPSARRVSQELSVNQAGSLYELQAIQMKAMGFTMNLAPVAEVCTQDNEKFLDGRSFGELEQVKEYGGVCLQAYETNGIASVLKHFPGNTNTDPHTGLPQINWTPEEMQLQLQAFKELIQKKPSALLMSHAKVSGYDEENPACLSHYWVSEVVRNQLGFEGIIFSDDIFMGALADNGFPPQVAVVSAIEAGIDCIMISEKRIADSVEVLCNKTRWEPAFEAKINQAVRRIIDYKIRCGFFALELTEDGQYNLTIKYPEFSGQAFDKAREENIKLYVDNF